MDAKEARNLVQRGEMNVEQLLDLLEKQQKTIRRLEAEIVRLTQRLAQYEPEIRSEQKPLDAPSREADRYSVQAEEKRRRPRKRRKKSPGRRKTKAKFRDATRFESVYPDGTPPDDCKLARERAVWRLIDGRAALVGYRVFRGPADAEPRIPGVTRRCEYGIEILVVLAFLVYIIGISLDKACAVLSFFCRLPLSKSQADALLRQLARHWEKEFEAICNLLAHAAVVYMDETGWKIGKDGCSLWTFASSAVRVFLFGCRKDDATLDQILPPDVFQGVGVSDDAAVYRGRFRRAQKCWAHLLRKAIRLALLYPRKKTYQRFLDELLQLYYDAKRAAADQRLGASGRARRVKEFEDRLGKIIRPHWRMWPEMKQHERDFANLAGELLDRMVDEELFTFVLDPEVEPTNNLPERLQRSPARDRDAGRTNKTHAGARRRSVIVSVLESLRVNLPQFSLDHVLDEVTTWMHCGVSMFAERWQQIKASSERPIFDTG
jgi:hypothetical protein